MTNKIVAVIPARSGSKRLVNKNKLPLAGKPLVLWTIEAAIKSGIFEEVVVSTDDQDILELAKGVNGVTALSRPLELSSDTSSPMDVLIHALASLEKEGRLFDTLVLLQPTSPLRNSWHIKRAYEQFKERSANTVVSVTIADHPVEWCTTLPADLSMDSVIDSGFLNLRSQDLPVRYRVNGAIYITKVSSFILNKSFWGEQTYAFVMEKAASIDIDEAFDLRLAEIILRDGAA